MNRKPIAGLLSGLMFLAILGGSRPTWGQTAQSPSSPAVAEVRQTLDAAQKEIEAFRSGGGKAGAPDHPALKWQATLWEYRQRSPGTEAAGLAAAEAIHLLVHAELWDHMQARIDSLSPDDPAWERLPTFLFEAGVIRKDFAYAVDKLSHVAGASTSAPIKAAALLTLGRTHRRQGDDTAAVKALEAARSTTPGSPTAREADGVLYEIFNLALGQPAPAFSGKSRDGRVMELAGLRGKAVVMVFWAST